MLPTARPLEGVADSGGLICGFLLATDVAAQPIAVADLDAMLVQPPAPTWLHFNLADTRAVNRIAAHSELPVAARQLFAEVDNHIRCERVDDGLLLVIGDLHHEFDGDPERFGVLRLYIDGQRIITGRHHPLKSLDQLRRQLLDGLVVPTPLALLLQLLDDLAETMTAVVAQLNVLVDDAEDEILAGHMHEQRQELGRVRRLLARLRRHVNAGRMALTGAVGALPAWCDERGAAELRSAVQRLEAVVQDIELVQERARLLQEEIAGRMGEATNRNLFVLSIVTVVLLPINLITGIFGMNVGGLPFAEDGAGFIEVMVVMIVAVMVSLWLLRSRQVL